MAAVVVLGATLTASATAASAGSAVDLTVTVNDGGTPMSSTRLAAAASGSWTVTARNLGTAPSTGETRVIVAPYNSVTGGVRTAAGAGWTCDYQWPNATCTTTAPAPAAGSLPPIVATLAVYGGYGYVGGSVNIYNAADNNAANNDIALRTPAVDTAADLTVSVDDGAVPFTASDNAQSPGGTWTATVRNLGQGATTAATNVSIEPFSSITGGVLTAGGPGWTCEVHWPTAQCSNPAAVPAGGVLPPLVASLGVYPGYGYVGGTVSVTNADDSMIWNDTASVRSSVLLGGAVDLTVGLTGVGNPINAGGAYDIAVTVHNSGTSASSGEIAVSYPEPMPGAAAAGPGWVCDQVANAGYGGTCRTSAVVAPGGSLPAVHVTGSADRQASAGVAVEDAAVDNTSDARSENNAIRASSPVQRSAVELLLNISNSGTPFVVGQPARYTLTVRNTGTQASAGPVTVAYPAMLTSATAAGQGWTCQAQQSRPEYGGVCTTTASAGPGASLAPITVTDTPPADRIGQVVTAVTEVANDLDGSYGNNYMRLDTPIAGAAAAPAITYAALGDSYSSGEGTFVYQPGSDDPAAFNSCHRSSLAYGPRLDTDAQLGGMLFAACSGALTDDLYVTNHSNPGERAQLDQLGTVGATVRTITLTIGGNDAGFARAIDRCVNGTRDWMFWKNTGWGCSKDKAFTKAVAARIRLLDGAPPPSLQVGPPVHPISQLLRDIHLRAPSAMIYIAGYPELFGSRFTRDRNAPSKNVCVLTNYGLLGDYTVDSRDADWLNTQARDLNAMIRHQVSIAAAAGIPVRYVSPGLFTTHALCDVSTAWINSLILQETIPGDLLSTSPTAEGFHPTPTGQQRGYEAAFKARLRQSR